MSNTPDSKQSQAPVLVDRNAVLDAVALFCANFDTLGERFKKQLRNTIRAVPRAAVAAVEGDALPRQEVVARIEKQIRLWNNDTVTMALADVLADLKSIPAAASSPASPCEYCAAPEHYSTAVEFPMSKGERWHRSAIGGYYRCAAPAPAQPDGEQET